MSTPPDGTCSSKVEEPEPGIIDLTASDAESAVKRTDSKLQRLEEWWHQGRCWPAAYKPTNPRNPAVLDRFHKACQQALEVGIPLRLIWQPGGLFDQITKDQAVGSKAKTLTGENAKAIKAAVTAAVDAMNEHQHRSIIKPKFQFPPPPNGNQAGYPIGANGDTDAVLMPDPGQELIQIGWTDFGLGPRSGLIRQPRTPRSRTKRTERGRANVHSGSANSISLSSSSSLSRLDTAAASPRTPMTSDASRLDMMGSDMDIAGSPFADAARILHFSGDECLAASNNLGHVPYDPASPLYKRANNPTRPAFPSDSHVSGSSHISAREHSVDPFAHGHLDHLGSAPRSSKKRRADDSELQPCTKRLRPEGRDRVYEQTTATEERSGRGVLWGLLQSLAPGRLLGRT
ncbi:hypothetical protein FDECE_8836 [Fusarium decemcellulare]|nr:hypothetical protein FDECE_8836 [Fusarium decemcellulare]